MPQMATPITSAAAILAGITRPSGRRRTEKAMNRAAAEASTAMATDAANSAGS